MTNTEFSASYLNTAKEILQETESLFQKEIWHLVVRRSQECVELCLKSLLRGAGIEVPHLHDVGTLLKKHSDRFPKWPMDRLVSISRRLREEREISFYGDDVTETPPEELYDKVDADQALQDVRWLLNLITEKY